MEVEVDKGRKEEEEGEGKSLGNSLGNKLVIIRRIIRK